MTERRENFGEVTCPGVLMREGFTDVDVSEVLNDELVWTAQKMDRRAPPPLMRKLGQL